MTLKQFFSKPIFSNYRLLNSIFFIIPLFVGIKYVFFSVANNYKIFYFSLQHLQNGESLYTEYPAQYFDHYHYAPTFAALFAPFFLMPYKVGLFLWNFLFTGVWVYAIYKMEWTKKQKVFVFWYVIQELLTSIDNTQTNPLIAVIPLFAYLCFEKKQPFWAAAFIMLGFNIKIYSLVTAALFIIYPNKIKFILSMLFWAVVLALLPLLFTTPEKLWWQYDLWFNQLFIKNEHDKLITQSIHRLVHQIISPNIDSLAIIGVGVLLFCTVFIHIKRFAEEQFKMLLLASILIFHVIFNPVAESATYVIAVTGVAIWWLYCPKQKIDWILIISCYAFTILSPTDLVPKKIQLGFIEPYVLKALPCVLIWFRLLYIVHFTKPIATKSIIQKN
jgi:Glycosyltransferase family 87